MSFSGKKKRVLRQIQPQEVIKNDKNAEMTGASLIPWQNTL